ncbi:endo alpha-1,4 polygalactosaminidase [Kineococcus sp. DHX-1]|uniref:endo alpha-1,4 polygalactosaminidase n=1 Tax=Kineococcus sp. DHX-1 TaxID=3349638 RepID=UPI0036D2AA22
MVPPPAGAVADYQLGGAYEPADDVRVVVRDRTAEPAAGLYSVCYVNAFQTQPQETGEWLRDHPDLLLRVDGDVVQDPGWPGEFLLDTTTPDKRAALAEVVGAWIDGCADAGFQAVEADNLDSATRSDGVLTMADAYAYSALLSARAHARGLAYAQKNAAGTTAEQARAAGFDFAVAESCQVYAECGDYTDVHGDRVLEVEYADDGREPFEEACAARGGEVSVVYRDRELLPRGVPGYEFDHC